MAVRAYGLFWRVDDVDWFPGAGPGPGYGRRFRLLGHRGERRPGLAVADFRDQSGIYILYGDYGPHYVGLTDNRLGHRLKSHLDDHHQGKWDRFSWFGFRQVLKSVDDDGLKRLRARAEVSFTNPPALIREMEALLISAMGLSNNMNKTKFPEGDEWQQVRRHEVGHYLERVAP